MIKLPLILEYDPKARKGNASKMEKPWWLIGATSCDISEYYAWFLRKRTGIVLQEPAWGAHVSIVRGEEPVNKELWRKYDGATFEISIDVDVKTNGKHWWLRAVSDEFKDIREELGLYRQGLRLLDGSHLGLHLTLGNPTPKHEEISRYYHRFFTQE